MPFRSIISMGQLKFLAALFIMGAVFYLASSYDTFPGDLNGIRKFQGLRSPWLDDAAIVTSSLANPWVAAVSIPALALILWAGRRKADAVVVLLIFIPEGIDLGVKELIGRPRPELFSIISPPGTGSFPSGHAVHAILLFGFLIMILGELHKHRWSTIAAQGLLGAMILACGASRVYLGVHWPSDVLGGYLLGAVSMAGLLWARKTLVNRGLQ